MSLWSPDRNLKTAATDFKEASKGPAGPEHERKKNVAAIRDYCSTWNEGRRGGFSEFKHAWLGMVVVHLSDQRLRENRQYTAITGKDVPGLDEYEPPACRKSL
jgi:hypothetical protein